MITAPYMGLAVWNSVTDTWNHEQLADNFRKLDEHDHASGKGVQIPTGGIKDGAITKSKLAPDTLVIEDGTIDTRHLRDLSVTNAKLAFNAINGSKIQDGAIGPEEIGNAAIQNRHLALNVRRANALHNYGRDRTRFTPNGTTKPGQIAQAPRANGETDTLKVSVPPNGGLLFIYAEGEMTVNPSGGKWDTDYVDVRAYAELNYGSTNLAIPLFLGRAEGLKKKLTASWASSPTDWGIHLPIRNAYAETDLPAQTNGGAAVVKYIPTPVSSELTVQIKLRLKVGKLWSKTTGGGGVRPDPTPPSVDFRVQTISAWSQSIVATELLSSEPV